MYLSTICILYSDNSDMLSSKHMYWHKLLVIFRKFVTYYLLFIFKAVYLKYILTYIYWYFACETFTLVIGNTCRSVTSVLKQLC